MFSTRFIKNAIFQSHLAKVCDRNTSAEVCRNLILSILSFENVQLVDRSYFILKHSNSNSMIKELSFHLYLTREDVSLDTISCFCLANFLNPIGFLLFCVV